ncbi:hypothetical protein EXIGLDRAFT_692587 [Exidia glandulosa HHB12029]|uniref:Ubiquitin-like domain-containing protein n=1 Tax=Exidia glandulosa HHB12029 TaxID=1314781 RepID=A0A165HWN5_EXIGL|nr:hypothetical protein EXIGLDRAFT_692587 [Exidia glandulosa HHB12029]
MFPVSCNAIGDIIALVQLGIDVVKAINDSRGAKTEHHELTAELETLKAILEAVESFPNTPLLTTPTTRAGDQMASALALLAEFEFSESVKARTVLSRVRSAWVGVRWTLRGRADVNNGLAKLSKSVDTLRLALQVASAENSATQFRAIHQTIGLVSSDVTTVFSAVSGARSIAEKVATDVTTIELTTAGIREATTSMVPTLVSLGQHVVANEQTLGDALTTLKDLHGQQMQASLALRGDVQSVVSLLREKGFSSAIHASPQGLRRFTRPLSVWMTTTVGELSTALLPSNGFIQGVCLGSLLNSAASAHSAAEQMAYALCATLLYYMTGMDRLYTAPRVVHVIFVLDMFGDSFELPCHEASTSTTIHLALQQKFNGRLGFTLTLNRMYELAIASDADMPPHVLPKSWSRMLAPGQKLIMSARIDRRDERSENDLRCPACGASSPTGCADKDGWIQCDNEQAFFIPDGQTCEISGQSNSYLWQRVTISTSPFTPGFPRILEGQGEGRPMRSNGSTIIDVINGGNSWIVIGTEFSNEFGAEIRGGRTCYMVGADDGGVTGVNPDGDYNDTVVRVAVGPA